MKSTPHEINYGNILKKNKNITPKNSTLCINQINIINKIFYYNLTKIKNPKEKINKKIQIMKNKKKNYDKNDLNNKLDPHMI